MDPNATFAALLVALATGEVEEARDAAETLAEWIARGGFKPAALVAALAAEA